MGDSRQSRSGRLLLVRMRVEDTPPVGEDPVDIDEVVNVAKGFGVDLEPLHPGVDDPVLARDFSARVGEEQADRVAEALRGCRAVEAAYVKPPDEPAR